MDRQQALLITALRCAVTGASPELPNEVDWGQLLRLARAHNVEGLVYEGLKSQTLPEEVKTYLSGATGRAIFQDVQQSYVYSQLCKTLLDAQIPHIFLKGSVLKHDYPIPALRTMSDMDVLVRSEDYAALEQASTSLGGVFSSGASTLCPGKVGSSAGFFPCWSQIHSRPRDDEFLKLHEMR